jgi:hypothetical protein
MLPIEMFAQIAWRTGAMSTLFKLAAGKTATQNNKQ